MTITVGASTPTGTYPITVTGNGGGIQQNTTVTLTVTGSSITLDGNVHGVQDNGLSASTTASVSIGTPTAGDLIACEVTFGEEHARFRRRQSERDLCRSHSCASQHHHDAVVWYLLQGKCCWLPDHRHAHDLTVAGVFRHFLSSLEGGSDLELAGLGVRSVARRGQHPQSHHGHQQDARCQR